MPRCFRRIAMPMPANPPPTIRILGSSCPTRFPSSPFLHDCNLRQRNLHSRRLLSMGAETTTTRRRRLSGEDRREQILDVTAAIVARSGFGAVSIQGVATAAGISRPIVYEHFGDLDGLLEALVRREMAAA